MLKSEKNILGRMGDFYALFNWILFYLSMFLPVSSYRDALWVIMWSLSEAELQKVMEGGKERLQVCEEQKA